MSNLLVAVHRSVVRGSKLFNKGKALLCAQLYYQTIQQVAQLLVTLGEQNAVDYLGNALARVQRGRPAPEQAAWFLREVLDTFVSTVRASPLYAPLFEEASADPLAAAFAQRVGKLDEETDPNCAFGLVVQRGDGGFWIAEARDADCDDELTEEDAKFFVEAVEIEADGDEQGETEEVFVIDVIEEVEEGDAKAGKKAHRKARKHSANGGRKHGGAAVDGQVRPAATTAVAAATTAATTTTTAARRPGGAWHHGAGESRPDDDDDHHNSHNNNGRTTASHVKASYIVMDVAGKAAHQHKRWQGAERWWLLPALLLPLCSVCLCVAMAWRRRRQLAQQRATGAPKATVGSMQVVYGGAHAPSTPYPHAAMNQPQTV